MTGTIAPPSAADDRFDRFVSSLRPNASFEHRSFVIRPLPGPLNRADRCWPVDCCLILDSAISSSVHRTSLFAAITLWKDDVLPRAAVDHLAQLRRRPPAAVVPRIGLALGGGFARGIAHAGVLKIFERHGIPLHCITGVSAGSIVAAAYASGSGPDEIARAASSMRIRDVARWSLCRMGFMASERMKPFLEGLLKTLPLRGDADSARRGGDRPLHRRTGVVPRYRRRGAAHSRELLLPGPVPAGSLGRSSAGGRRDERRDSRPAGARTRRDARHLGVPAGAALQAASGQCLPGHSPMLPDHAAAQRGWLAARERPGHRSRISRPSNGMDSSRRRNW